MNDFEYIDKALGVVYMQDDLLAMFSLVKILGKDGDTTYESAKTSLTKFISALKSLESIVIGEGVSKITLEQLLKQFENSLTRAKAFILLQQYHQDLVTKINLQTSTKQKSASVDGMGVLLYAYSLVQAFYSAKPLATLLKAVHTLAVKENGYTYVLEQIKNSENAPYYLYSLLMPSEIIDENNNAKEVFLEKLDLRYEQSGLRKKISTNLRGKRFEEGYYYEMLYYVLSYFADSKNYAEVHNKISEQSRESESYYIISKDLYPEFPITAPSTIDEKLKSVLFNAETIQKKTNEYFKELEQIKKNAEKLKEYKRKTLNVSLKQAILMSKLNLAVAMLHELGTRLSKLDIEIKDKLFFPKESVINTRKLPRFQQWCNALDELMSRLNNKRDSFSCLIYHKIMSAILTRYDELSKIYDEMYTGTAYDDQAIRSIVKTKAKMIANIQMDPLKLLGDVCDENNVQRGDKETIKHLFLDFNSEILPITKNCLEEFCYSSQTSLNKQYQLAKRETHRHPLYPLITIYSEWYKLRSFILFFERFGSYVSNYFLGFEEVNGVAFEIHHKDLVYLSYAFGAIYNDLEQSAQAMLLKYMAIFAIDPSDENYYLAFKKFAIIESCIFTHSAFKSVSFHAMLNRYIKKENLEVSNQFIEFMKSCEHSRSGFTLSSVDQYTYTLAYQADSQYQFELIVTNNEFTDVQAELGQLYELSGVPALTAIAMVVFIKSYNDKFLTETRTKIDNFKGFYTSDIFTTWRRAGVKSKDKTLRLVNLDDDHSRLLKLLEKLQQYKTTESIKHQANNFLKEKCQLFISCFTEKTRLNLEQIKSTLDNIDRMLSIEAIIKATGKSKCKENLLQSKNVFRCLYQKLVYLDISCFSQHIITGLKPFKSNRKFIDMLAYYLTKTFARNEEVVVTRYSDLPKQEGFSNINENGNFQLALNKQSEVQLAFQPSYKKDCEILGIIHERESGREIVPRDISNKFYFFLKMLINMCEYYMDSIIRIFGDHYDKKNKERFDQFLDKLLEDFQIAVNTDFKTTYLDKVVSDLKLNIKIINLYVIFSSAPETDRFKEENNIDLNLLYLFIEESVASLKVRSFDKVKFFDSSYREFSLIESFIKVYDELNYIYTFMKNNDNFIILSRSDLFNIYKLENDQAFNKRLSNPEDKQAQTLKTIFEGKRTKCFKIKDLKRVVDSYELYLTKHVIFPEYNENTVLSCGLLCYEYNQIITIIYQDILERSQNYHGLYKFKWWHVASLGFGAAIDYLYTTNNLAEGIKEIQTIISRGSSNTNQQIQHIIAVANKRLQKNSKRNDSVRRLYAFLNQDLSKYIAEKTKQINLSKPDFEFRRVSTVNQSSFEQHLNKKDSYDGKEKFSSMNDSSLDIDINNTLVLSISQNLAPLNLLTPELRASMALDIVQDIASHNVERASFISNGFIDICVGKRHQEGVINLNQDDKFIIKPCRTILSDEIEKGNILTEISQLVAVSKDSLIILPISFGNWHFMLFMIDTVNKRLYFFDSLNGNRAEWAKSKIKVLGIERYQLVCLTESFQQNNDCGFLVLAFIDQIYLRNNKNMDMVELYRSIKKGYDSSFLRQYFCHYAGKPYAADNWVFTTK
ncbi:hypothetical protein EDC55_10319 [Allofrancisella inopinata]|uniref:Ubiquitin-like protease family profile domain-containing protein n=1 Tax=Allofrancisella inopinata TaxID=1085647 RepID=A0AAE6YJB4_9GAMM|nr:hypothetical protein [Allofrancisella inopinata]QIV96696.1 hypothetical protein E4K63_07580 [Allofrancisella inopinata]TDT73450.1 hypothetical protein EDC55_10319 [Allofrancisella inopinata]